MFVLLIISMFGGLFFPLGAVFCCCLFVCSTAGGNVVLGYTYCSGNGGQSECIMQFLSGKSVTQTGRPDIVGLGLIISTYRSVTVGHYQPEFDNRYK